TPLPAPYYGGIGVCTGPNLQNEKKSDDKLNLFINSKFCMIFVALIPVTNYNAQIAFKREINNGHLWIRTGFHKRPGSRGARGGVDGCRLRQGVQRESLRCKDRSRRAGQAN